MKPTEPHPHENCMALFEKLSEYIDKELDPPTCQAIEAHIDACKPCQVCLNTLKKTVEMCKHLQRREVPEALSLKLKAAIADLANDQSV